MLPHVRRVKVQFSLDPFRPQRDSRRRIRNLQERLQERLLMIPDLIVCSISMISRERSEQPHADRLLVIVAREPEIRLLDRLRYE